METHFSREARRRQLNDRQYDVVIGSLLGDATLAQSTRGYCFRVHHGLRQRALADWKYLELRDFVRTPPKVSGSGYYFRTVTHDIFTEMRNHFYEERRKVVPIDLLDRHLGCVGLATWIMDDGALDGNQLRLNTQSFSVSECRSLIDFMIQKFRVYFRINFDKGKPRLRCTASSVSRLVDLVEPHIIPEMRYKLPGCASSSIKAPRSETSAALH